jgi:hypothetical protein
MLFHNSYKVLCFVVFQNLSKSSNAILFVKRKSFLLILLLAQMEWYSFFISRFFQRDIKKDI